MTSLRDDHEVSCLEPDASRVARAAGAHGARMHRVAALREVQSRLLTASLEETAQAVAQAYSERGLDAPAFVAVPPGRQP